MLEKDQSCAVWMRDEEIFVTYGTEPERHEEFISLGAIAGITVEHYGIFHWYLLHSTGWTLHFNEEFSGAAVVAAELSNRLGFKLPIAEEIGRNGTILWGKGVNQW